MDFERQLSDTESTPPLVYHYTTQRGLLGIVGGANIWATDIRFMNDSAEWKHIYDVVEELFESSASESDSYRELVGEYRADVSKHREPDVYLASFSRDGDKLSQWRAYSQGSGGFSLGFRTSALAEITKPVQFAMKQCVYGRVEQRSLLNQLLSKSLRGEGPFAKMGGAVQFTIFVRFLASSFKHHSFAEEEEWRLVSSAPVSSSAVRFRAGGTTLIPYLEADVSAIENLGLEEIVVGPSPNPEQSASAVELLVKSAGHRGIRVRNSATSYRDW
jgi:hypothetical protein